MFSSYFLISPKESILVEGMLSRFKIKFHVKTVSSELQQSLMWRWLLNFKVVFA